MDGGAIVILSVLGAVCGLGALVAVALGRLARTLDVPAVVKTPPPDARRTASNHWEVFAAVAIMILVVAGIDADAVREPRLVLSLAPVVILVVAALTPITVRQVAAWTAASLIAAAVSGDVRYAGLAYPAIALGGALVAHRLAMGHR